MEEGEIKFVEIESTADGQLNLLSPWQKIAVRRDGEERVSQLNPDDRGIVCLNTKPGEKMRFQR